MRKTATLACLVVFLTLGACGGGDEAVMPQAAAKAMASQAKPLAALPMASVTAADQAEQLLNKAETSFAAYFPEHHSTGFAGPFAYRHYSTDVYLGVVIQDGTPSYPYLGVYVVGSPFGNSLANPLYVGQLWQFVTVVDPSTASGTLVVSNATNSARNGSYAPQVGHGSSTGTDIDITGATPDGQFEMDVLFTAAGAIKTASVWYFNGTAINFFGCDNSVAAISCGSAVSYDPALVRIRFNSATLTAIDNVFPGPATKAASGEAVTISGSVSAK